MKITDKASSPRIDSWTLGGRRTRLACGGTVLCVMALVLPALGCTAEVPGPRARYTTGHADLLMDLETDTAAGMQVFLVASGAAINGERTSNKRYELADISIVSGAMFERPTQDNGAFAALCAEPGQSVRWLPQSLEDASRGMAPFLGLTVNAPRGMLVEDRLSLRLISAAPDSGSGHYALWRDGFPPKFYMSTCDGIDTSDELPLPVGHDHFNMAFSAPGQWTVRYGVSAATVDGGTISSEFSVNYALL